MTLFRDDFRVPIPHGRRQTLKTVLYPMDIPVLLQQFLEEANYMKGFTRATLRRYRTCLAFFVRQTGITDSAGISEAVLRQFFLRGRTDRNWSAQTYVTYHKTLRLFFRWCVRQAHMAANPADAIERPKLEKRLPANLSRDAALRLLEVCANYPTYNAFSRSRNRAILATCLFAGLRKTELRKLQFADVDVNNFTIFVRQGKGQKDRLVPMSRTLAGTLRAYIEERMRAKKTCPEFFTSSKNNKGIPEMALRTLVEEIREAAEIPFSLHKLRHTFATLMIEGGCDIYSLSKMMGHSEITTTTIYLAASPEHLRSQITKHPLNDETTGPTHYGDPRGAQFAHAPFP